MVTYRHRQVGRKLIVATVFGVRGFDLGRGDAVPGDPRGDAMGALGAVRPAGAGPRAVCDR